MDLTPPITLSPASTPKTCCPSEASSSDHPSPGLVEQNYSLSSAYDADPTCGMAPSMTPPCHSPPLHPIAQSGWSPAAALHPSLTTASITNILSAEYDVFAPCDGSYSAHLYSTRYQNSQHILPVARSPASEMRPSLQYPTLSSPSSPPTPPRIKAEELASDYGYTIETSHYPSPAMANESYPGEVASHPSLPPLELPPHSNTACNTTDGMPASWPRPAEYPAEPHHLYPASSIQPSLMLPVRRCSTRLGGERPRRTPRKLTTKEEANFQCDIQGCGKFFSRSYNFKAHMETHREKREYPFPCQVEGCSKRFVRKTDLQRHHQSVHMKERNHGCEFCSRMFARIDTLKRYARTRPTRFALER